ncbi:hypothetical protein J1614_008845 [Plenodomus biglobosus]|nr:hypothetical protein J1614_008845 [Plenodomus biglobosus]
MQTPFDTSVIRIAKEINTSQTPLFSLLISVPPRRPGQESVLHGAESRYGKAAKPSLHATGGLTSDSDPDSGSRSLIRVDCKLRKKNNWSVPWQWLWHHQDNEQGTRVEKAALSMIFSALLERALWVSDKTKSSTLTKPQTYREPPACPCLSQIASVSYTL